MGIFEILVVVIVAIIFLGPEKFPQAIIDIAKFFRAVKKTLNDAKDTLDKEINIEELKKETLEYQKLFENNLEGVSKGIRIEELEDARMSVENEIKSVQDLMQDYEYSLEKDKLLSNLNEEVSSDEPFKETELIANNNTEKSDKEKEHV